MSITKKGVLLFIITTIVLVMICSGVLFAADTKYSSSACWVRWWDEPTSIPEGLRYIWNIQAQFCAKNTTSNYPALKTVANRHIKRDWVRLYETVNGVPKGKDYTQWSATAPSSTYSNWINNKLTMWDSIGMDYKTNVGWNLFYF